MKDRSTKRYTLEEVRRLKGQTDWDRQTRAGDHEAPSEIEIDWSTAQMVQPEVKKAISLRVDQEVLDFFKAQGKGYQTRMNAVLRSYMDAVKSGQA